jgi:ribosome-binding factor A
MKIRPERVAQLMRREVADVLANKLRDPRLSHWVSVTDVVVSDDLSFAKVFVSILPTGEERARTLEALSGAAGFVRRELAPRLGLREVPELRFMLDSSIERGARVEELLKKIEQGEAIDDEEPA